MKKLIGLIGCCFICANSFGQGSWHSLENAPIAQARFDDVFFLDGELGWAADGSGARVFKTIDGGATWELQFTGEGYFRNIEFLNGNIGFLGTLNAKFYKTEDGGETWQLVNIDPNPAAICGLDAVGASTVYGCGAYFSPAYVIKSTDGGGTWEYTDMSAYASALVEILFVDENLGYVSGKGSDGNGVILKTTDGGATWAEIYNSGVQGDFVWKLQLMHNNTYLYGSVQALGPSGTGRLIKSFDSGNTWVAEEAPEAMVQAVGFVTPTHGWMGGHTTGFYETFDGGDTWTDTGIGANLNRIFVIDENLAYAAGHTIYKFGDGLSIEQAGEMAHSPSVAISVAPVPVGEKLKVEVVFEHSNNLTIDLYSINGRFIARLLRDTGLKMGAETYTFDFPYPTGSYILDFHYNSGRKPIIVVKK